MQIWYNSQYHWHLQTIPRHYLKYSVNGQGYEADESCFPPTFAHFLSRINLTCEEATIQVCLSPLQKHIVQRYYQKKINLLFFFPLLVELTYVRLWKSSCNLSLTKSISSNISASDHLRALRFSVNGSNLTTSMVAKFREGANSTRFY